MKNTKSWVFFSNYLFTGHWQVETFSNKNGQKVLPLAFKIA